MAQYKIKVDLCISQFYITISACHLISFLYLFSAFSSIFNFRTLAVLDWLNPGGQTYYRRILQDTAGYRRRPQVTAGYLKYYYRISIYPYNLSNTALLCV